MNEDVVLGNLKEPIGQCRFAMIDVGDDREVAQVVLRDTFHGIVRVYQDPP